MIENCKRCLLLESGKSKSFESIKEYISTISPELKVSSEIYQNRLEECRKCDNLISGMCLKCGCYTEVRAVFKDKKCPDYDNRKW